MTGSETSGGDEAPAERDIRRAWEAGDFDAAATALMQHYGHEVMGFLHARVRTADQADEAFAAFGEAVWKALPAFAWRCSVRGWAYALARRAAANQHRAAARHQHMQPLTQASRLSEAIAHVRSETAPYLRTATKDRFQRLRERLSDDDQLVLILRVDRGLSWTDLAHVMLQDATDLVDGQDGATYEDATNTDAVKKESARLRKRFQLIKQRLRELAIAEGLIE